MAQISMVGILILLVGISGVLCGPPVPISPFSWHAWQVNQYAAAMAGGTFVSSIITQGKFWNPGFARYTFYYVRFWAWFFGMTRDCRAYVLWPKGGGMQLQPGTLWCI